MKQGKIKLEKKSSKNRLNKRVKSEVVQKPKRSPSQDRATVSGPKALHSGKGLETEGKVYVSAIEGPSRRGRLAVK